MSQTCPPTPAISRPLSPLPSWNANLSIPTILFKGISQGSFIKQSFVVSSTGAFSVSDDHGNSFSFVVPAPASGTSTSTLTGNSTTAIQETRVVSGSSQQADLKLTFSVYKQFCQPAGIRLEISGTENWGASSRGIVRIVFDKKPLSLSASRAWFGNTSGVGLGFDWSDSAKLSPSFSSLQNSSLNYDVGSSFEIDPTTIGTTTWMTNSLEFDSEPKICYGNGNYFAFYNANPSWYYTSSPDGVTWSTPTLATTGADFSLWCSGNTIYYAFDTGQYNYLYWSYGTMNSNGTITWAYRYGQQIAQSNVNIGFPSITVNSTGGIFIQDSGQLFYQKKSATSGTWQQSIPGIQNCFSSGTLVPLTGGKVACVYGDGVVPQFAGHLCATVWSGSGMGTWSATTCTSASTYIIGTSDLVAIGDTVEVAASTGNFNGAGPLYFLKFSSGTWSSPVQLASSGVYAGISTDGSSTLSIFYSTGTSTVNVISSTDSGADWSPITTISTSETSIGYLSMSYWLAGPNLAFAEWTEGSSSPYSVRFASIPAIVPIAAVSANSWSKPGLSPYESYFSNLNEYVSPGNGLLSVGFGTANIPSRGGLIMQAGLVYSQPYAFKGSSVYHFDNSTLGNVGAGWSLNLPWLGTYYVHLGDGQAIPLAWSGRSFVYHGSIDFNITKGSSGCPCTLMMKDGMTYTFNSTNRLTTQTDRTGNNTITFTWGTYGIKQIGDARLSSAIQITYDTSHRVSTIAESGATWTLAYSTTSPSQLTSVTDQLSRQTQFQYAATTGANLWLLSAVLYPTGGKSTYTFGSGAVGTEVTTEYVTARNVYSATSPLTLSRTDSISYRIINGQVLWANNTYSDGVSTQGYLRMHFLSPLGGRPFELEYDVNSTGSVARTIARYFDGKGRLNQTQTFDPYAGYWPVNEGVGSKTVDISGNGENGTLGCVGTGCTNPSWSSGLFRGALNFNPPSSTASYVAIANSKPLQLAGSFTWSFWFKPGTTMIGKTGYLLDKHAAVAQEYLCYYGQDSGHANQIRCTVYLGGVGYTVYSTSTFSASNAGKWTLVDFAFDTAAHKVYLYLNGTLQATTTTSSSALTLNTAQVLLGTGEATGGSPGSTFPFFGTLDEVRAYTIALSSSQVSSIYSTSVLPGMVVLASSMSAFDSWGNLKYSKDNVGHELWSSFANTDSSGSLGSSGCATSGFYTQTVKSSIHDLLIGQCDYQNGSGSAVQESFKKYDRSGDLLTNKVLHNTSWLKANFTYDHYGNQLSATDFNGHTTYFRYSSTYSSAFLTKRSILVGAQNVTTKYAYTVRGLMLNETDPNVQTTIYQYDALGRVTQTTYPAVGGVNAIQKTYYYDGNDTMKLVDPNGHVTKEYFDGLARQTKVERWNGSSAYSAETYTYNWLNAVATKTTATSNTYTYSYDWNGRLTKLANPDTTYSTTVYNDVTNLKTVADERGHKTVYAYDWNQRLTAVNEYNATASHYTTIYSYDLSGNQLSTKDGKNQTTSYLYDDLNRLNTTTFPTSPSTKEERSYDSVGNLLTRITANSSKISYTYDNLNRLTKVTYPGSGGSVTYTYDPASNRLTMVNPSASDYYTYDTMSRETNSTEYVGGTKYQTLYSYDKASNVVQVTYPDAYALSMTYDGVNRLKKVGTYATIGYTVDDKISKITYGNTEVATYTYDTRDRPTRILDKYGSTKELDLNYTYDGTGNVLTLNTEAYHYDWLNRLNYSSGPWTTITYAYDQVGNRVKMVQGTTTTYSYGAFNRLSSAGSTSYTYDANGNMKTKTGGWTYSYDYENRLTKAVQSGTTVQQNSYDGNGNRIKQIAGSNTFTYSYQGLSILYEKNVTGGTTTVTKHFYAGGMQVAKMVGSTTYYLHQDALGSTRLVATSTVTIKFSSNYVPYGTNYAISGKEVFMYTGKPYDSATGFYYEGARYYDSSTGRFVTQDSVTGTQEDPQSLNRYVYARDNPMKIVDLAGHEWWNPVSWVSSAASTVSTGITDVAGAVSSAWNSLPPQDQAIVTTVAVDVAAGVSVVACPVLAPTLVGAAISTTAYTLSAGSSATFAGAAGAAVGGAVAGTFTAGLGSLGGGALASGVSGLVSNFAGSAAGVLTTNYLTDGSLGFKSSQLGQILVGSALGGVAGTAGRYLTSATLSAVGRPATRWSTLASSLLDPEEHPRAAYQVYGNPNYGVYALGLGIDADVWGRAISRNLGFS